MNLINFLHKNFGILSCTPIVDEIIASDLDDSGGWWEMVNGHCKICQKKLKMETTACENTSAAIYGFAPAYLIGRCNFNHTKDSALKFIKENNIKFIREEVKDDPSN
jgi:hypothetical protein